MMDPSADARLVSELRRALHHLYEPAVLRRSPLLPLFGLDPREGPFQLRRLLLAGVESLKPGAGVPRGGRPWRDYDTLLRLYVQQFNQPEVAAALGVSTRQLRRQEQDGLLALAEYLWTRYDLRNGLRAGWPAAKAAEDDDDDEGEAPSREEELRWLGESSPTEPAAVAEIWDGVLRTSAPLLQALGVRVTCSGLAGLPRVAVQVPAARQAFLHALTASVRCVPRKVVEIAGSTQADRVVLELRPAPSRTPTEAAVEGSEGLAMARQLLELLGGSLQVVPGGGEGAPACVRLDLPAAGQITVLAIDDNADTLQLFQRYLAGTRYAFVGARGAQQALALAEELAPQVIVLDVMLPGMDGWELLGHLREHPRTRAARLITCTILPDEQLALTLGADTFLRKPVGRATFLAALDQVLASMP